MTIDLSKQKPWKNFLFPINKALSAFTHSCVLLGLFATCNFLHSADPVIDPGGGGTTISYPENDTSAVTTLDIQDTGGGHSIDTVELFGVNADEFTITNIGGNLYEVTFNTQPDFEGPITSYVFSVKATDSNGDIGSEDFTVNITDFAEGPVIISSSTFGRQEVTVSNPNDVELFTVMTDIPATNFSVSGGADQAAFSIDNSGVLVFNDPPDFDDPHDANLDNVYNIDISADDGGDPDTKSFIITIVNVNEPPVILQPTNPGFTFPENNTTPVATIDAEDPDGDAITSYSTSGADVALFSFNSTSGELTFIDPPNYESPQDSNGDNTYEVTISARDSTNRTGSISLFVAIEDVNDTPSFTIDTTSTLVTDTGGGAIQVDGFETRENGGTGFVFSSAALSKITVDDEDHNGTGLPSPELWIRLDETSGTSVADSSGNGHTITFQGNNPSPSWASGNDATHNRDYNGLEFNGTTDYLEVSDVPGLRPGEDNYSISFWFQLNNTANPMPIFRKGDDLSISPTPDNGILAYFNNNDIVFRTTDGTNLAHAFEPAIDTDWHHFTAVINRNTEIMILYIDSVPHLQTSGYVSSNVDDLETMGSIDNTDTIWIGRDADDDYFRGILDDIRVYTSPLSASQVSEIYSESTDNTVTVTLQVTHGTLTLGDPAVSGISYSSGDGTDDTTMVFSGSVTDVTTALEGMVYNPNEEYNGTDQLNYHIADTDDNGTVQLGTLNYTLNVQAINDAPENQIPLPQTINEGSTLTFRVADGNGITITDDATDNSGDIQVTLTAGSNAGTLTLGITADLTFTTGDGSQDTTMTFEGTVDKVNDALDSLSFSLQTADGGDPDFNGATSITITTNDLGNFGLDDITTPDAGSDSQQETDLDTITINVTAVNDPITFLSGDASIPENQTEIYQISVDDPDLNDSPSTETTTYTITGGADAAFFNLAGDGTLSFTSALDFETPQDTNGDNDYLVTIQVEDSAGNTDEETFTFTITDLNENPSITPPVTTAITVVEGTTDVLTTITYTDPEGESVGGGDLTLALSGDDAALFSLNTGNGELTFQAAPDFESPQDADSDNVYEVSVVATDSAANTDTLWFAISVTDDNDAPVINIDDTAAYITDLGGGNFDVEGFETSVNGDPGFHFSTANTSAITITDADYDSSGLPSPTLWLKLDQQSGTSIIDSSANAFTASLQGGNSSPTWISETDATHNREVQALQLNGTTDYIRVQDATVLRPGSESYTLSFWFKPDSTGSTQALFAKGTEVSTTNTEGFLAYLKSGDAVVRAADGNNVAHAFAPSISTDWHHFAAVVNRNKELLTLYFDNVAYPQQIGYDGSNTEDLADFEDIQPIDAIEIGYDGTNYFAGAMDDIRIYNTPLSVSQVTEVYSDNTPGLLEVTLAVTNGLLTLGDPAASGLAYTTGDGTDDVTMTFTGTTSVINSALDGLSYTPTDDFNGADTLNVSVTDTDEFGTESDSAAYTLTVQPINRAPVITIPTGQALDEATSITFQAASSNGISISDDADENPGTESIEVTLTAQANTGVLSLGTTTGLSFTTGDGDNDVVIVFTSTLADANAALDTLTFSLVEVDGGDDDFNGSATITISVNDQANFGADDQVSADPAQDTQEEITTEILTLTVNPVNDPFTINENSSTMDENDTDALTVTVDDPDTTDTHTFVIIGGADQALFDIDTNTGVLSFISPPDFENPLGSISDDSNTYEVTILATDSEGLTDSQAIEVTVFDVNDVPTFITATTDYSPLENQTAIADIDGEDQDAGQTLLYSIASSTYSSLFAIDSVSGVLTFASPPDFESPGYVNADTSYTIDVHATDDGGSPLISAPLTLTITLTDENEVPDITTSASLDFDEEQTAVTTITVSDPDAGDSHTYSIVGGGDMAEFSIDESSGALSFVSAPSFEDPQGSVGDGNTYEVTIRATDSGGLTDDHTIEITIQDVNDLPVFTIASSAFSADENQTLAQVITAEDEDLSSSEFYSQLSFAIPSGLDVGHFLLTVLSTNPSSASAILAFSAAPDFENPTDSNLDKIYAVTVQISDGIVDVEEDLAVTINNVNDAPVFSEFPTLQVVNEDESLDFGPATLNTISVSDEDILADGVDLLEVTLSVDNADGTLSVTGQPGLAHTGNDTDTLVLTANPDVINDALETLVFRGAQDFHGDATLRILIDDQGSGLGDALTTEQTLTITVNPINDAPTANFPIGSPETDEDTPYTFVFGTATSLSVEDVDDPTDTQNLTITFSVQDTDTDGSPDGTLQLASSTDLTFTAGNGIAPFSVLAFSGAIADINAALDGMIFTPDTNFNGIATIDVQVSDVSLFNDLSWNITVNPVNDPPIITLPEPQLMDEDDTLYFRTVSNVAQVDQITFSNGANGDAFSFTLDDESIVIPFDTTRTITATNFANTVNTPGVLPPSVTALDLGGGIVRLTAATAGEPFHASIEVETDVSGFANASIQTTTLNVSDNTIEIWDDASETSSDVSVRLSVSHGLLKFTTINNITFDTVAGGTADQAINSGANLFVFSGTVPNINNALQWIEYEPTAEFNGDDALFLTVDDMGNNGSGADHIVDQNVIITINPVNDGPTVTAPTTPQFIDEDSTLTFNASNGNQVSVSDPDAGEVSGQLLVSISAIYGKVSLSSIAGLTTVTGSTPTSQAMSFTGLEADVNNALNNLRYIPDANHNNNISSDAITISVNDQANHGTGELTDSKTIPLDITPVNDAPSIVIQNLSPSMNEGEMYVFSNAAGTPITINDDAFEVDGTVQITMTSGEGVFTLASTLDLDIVVGGIGVEEPIITISGKQDALEAALNGLVYKPLDGDGFGFSGTDSLVFLVEDLGNEGTGGFLEGSTTVNLTIDPVNDAPVQYFNGSQFSSIQTAQEDTPFIFSPTEGNAITIADDASEAGFTVQTTLQVSSGTLTLGDTSGLFLVFSQGDGQEDSTMVIDATVSDMNTALDGLIFNPSPNSNDTVTLTITTNDLGNTGSGGAKEDSDLVFILVEPVNDAPTLSVPSSSVHTLEDIAYTFSGANLFSVADDASEADLSVSVSVSATYGTITLSLDEADFTANNITRLSGFNGTRAISISGPVNSVNLALNGMSYQPDSDFVGTDMVNVLVEDQGNHGDGDTLSVEDFATVIVDPVNDEPKILVPGSQIAFEDNFVVFSDATFNGISISDVDTYSPSSALLITVQLTDQLGTVVNNRGTITLGTRDSLFFTSGDGTDDFSMTFQSGIAEANTAFEGLIFTPANDFSGDVYLRITVNDQGNTGIGGSLTVQDSIFIPVGPTNDTPIILMPSSQTVNEDGQLVLSGSSVQVFDDANPTDELFVAVQVTNGTVLLGSTSGLDVTSTSTSHTFEATLDEIAVALDGLAFTPTADYYGDATLTITVNDQGAGGLDDVGASDSQVLDITVTSINDQPTISLPEEIPTVKEGGIVALSQFTGYPISFDDVDIGSGNVRVTIESDDGIISLATTAGLTFQEGDGFQDPRIVFLANLFDANEAVVGLTYSPNPNPGTTGQILFTIDDQGNSGLGGTLSNTSSLTINIDKQPPVIQQGESVLAVMRDNLPSSWVSPTITAVDENGQTMTWSLHSQASSGAATVSGTGFSPTIEYVPNAEFIGNDAFVVRVTDASGNTDTVLVNVLVNSPPIITTTPPTEHSGGIFNYSIGVIDADPQDPISFTALELPFGINLLDHGNRTATVTGTFANPPSVTPWSESVAVASGWRQNWFGIFHVPEDSNGWVYHAEFGWVYSQSTDPASFWFWTDRLGWTWTSQKKEYRIAVAASDGHSEDAQEFNVTVGVFPFLYSHDGASWLYYEDGSVPAQVYYYAEDRWTTTIYQYDINATLLGDPNAAVITGAGIYDRNTQVTITATANEDYNFLGWTGDIVSSSPTLTFDAVEDLDLFANYEAKVYHQVEVLLTDNTTSTPTVSPAIATLVGDGRYEIGTTASLSVTGTPGYIFEGWTGDTSNLSLTPSELLQPDITFTVLGSYTLRANFYFDLDEWQRLNP